MNYQIASKTAAGAKKEENESNGDWYKWFESDHCVVLTLADGLGSCASDIRASHTACGSFIEKCESAISQNVLLDEATLHRFCEEIDPVLARHDDMTCFSAVVWYKDADQVVWINVGDTRIYKHSRSGQLIQITVDDRAVENKKSNDPKYGTYRTDHGALVASVGVNRALGDCKLAFHTGSFEFNPGESIILSSDGMYNSSSFVADLAELIGKADMGEAIRRIETTDNDDNTLLVIRRGMAVDVDLNDLMDDFGNYQATIPHHVMTDFFCDALEKALQSGAEVHQIAKMASFMRIHRLLPDKKRITRLYDNAVMKLNAMPQGVEYQQLYVACSDLKEILKYVFTH